jgi:hypothetical protein
VSSCLSHLSTAFGQLDPPRTGEYDGQTGAGNPTQCALVRNYRAGYLQWAKGGGFEAQAAVPLSETKVHQLVLALRQAYDEKCSTDPSISVALFPRDSVNFLYLWERWQRGAEAGAIHADRVRFTDGGMEVEIGDTKANCSGFSGSPAKVPAEPGRPPSVRRERCAAPAGRYCRPSSAGPKRPQPCVRRRVPHAYLMPPLLQ